MTYVLWLRAPGIDCLVLVITMIWKLRLEVVVVL